MSNDADSLSNDAQKTSEFYYTAANHNLLLEGDIKTEIVDKLAIFKMPHAPSWCSGMISLRGKIIPVLDIAFMLKTEASAKTPWLLILESAPLPQVAIKIDRLPARIGYSEDKVTALTNNNLHWLLNSVSVDGLTLFKVNHRILFQQLIDENSAQSAEQDTNNKQDFTEDEV